MAEVAKPVRKQHRTFNGVDLSNHKASLDRLVDEIVEWYVTALDDWKSRNSSEPFDPITGEGKPHRDQRKNAINGGELGPEYDYGEDAGLGFSETWDQHWERFYSRRTGQPKLGFNGVPTAPLEVPYIMLRDWWLAVVRKPWRPTYPDSNDLTTMSPAGRLFLLVSQKFCDERCEAANCGSVHSRLSQTTKKRQRRAERQRERVSEKQRLKRKR
ncbi:MAG TPA: hypothetical protein VHT03_06325 [Rhizomicrobium sp.]|jgi:hypothetical protein|nr:hypothetical protein [Rhizomicrobium sp.]